MIQVIFSPLKAFSKYNETLVTSNDQSRTNVLLDLVNETEDTVTISVANAGNNKMSKTRYNSNCIEHLQNLGSCLPHLLVKKAKVILAGVHTKFKYIFKARRS